MMEQLSLEDVYYELNSLLKDVCSFLTTEVQNGSLSAMAQNKAEKLVARSQKQVQVISTISLLQDTSNITYPYLEMQGRNEVTAEQLSEYVDADNMNHYDMYEEENYDQIETHPGEMLSIPPVLPAEENCPYNDLSVGDVAKRAVKFGPLYRKERYFILDKKQQYFVGLLGYWLMIFANNKKDSKTILSLNLINYTAQAVEQKKDPIFEIICDNLKTYEFIARSSKDMEQWIVAINHKKQKIINVRDLPSLPELNSSIDSTDMVTNNNTQSKNTSPTNEFGSEGDIYESLEDIRHKHRDNTKPLVENTPTLPPRQPIYNTFVNKSTEPNEYNNFVNITEEENTYDPVQNDHEEEEFYDELNILPTPKVPPNIEEDCNYDIPRKSISEEELIDYDELVLPDSIQKPPQNTVISSKKLPVLEVLPPSRAIHGKSPTPQIDGEEYDDLKMLPTEKSSPFRSMIKITKKQPTKLKPTPSNVDEYDELKIERKSPIRPTKKQTKIIAKSTSDDEEYDELKMPPNERISPLRPVIKINKKKSKHLEPPPSDGEEYYDELKMPTNVESPKKVVDKKPVMSPKPKMTKVEKLASFSRKGDGSSDKRLSDGKENSSRIHGIIQQMEATLSFKSTKHS